MMDTATLLLEFSRKTGVSGQEGPALDYARALLEPYGPCQVTPLGSLLCTVREPLPGEPHVLLDAHLDEIGMIVTYIEDSGFLRVGACGGVDSRLLLAAPVTVHTRQGDINGVICSIPPHLSAGEEKKNKKAEEIYIDIGYDKEQAQRLVCPGDRVTTHSTSRALLGGQITGKAIDDRAGCVSHLFALEQLAGQELRCGLSVAFTSMEEVGGQGARTAAYTVNPTHALAVDVSFAHTPDAPKERCGLLDKGPMIGFHPILSAQASQKLVQLAQQAGLPFQYEVMGGNATHTNADAIAVARGGVKTALLSIPQKYMHTPVEVVTVQDVENVGRLTALFIQAVSRGDI